MTFIILSALLYFLPTIIGRHSHDSVSIFIVNLLFGWTVIGWFVALIWACSAERYVPVRMVPVSGGAVCSPWGALLHFGGHFFSPCCRAVWRTPSLRRPMTENPP